MMLVSPDKTADFQTIQQAVDSLPKDNPTPAVIHLAPGIYREKLIVDRPNVTLLGENAEKTVITWGDGAKKRMPDGTEMGTFRSYSVHILGNDFHAENITFENTAGPGSLAGQAVAVGVDADRAIFRSCRFLGHQDTLFTGSKPPKMGLSDPEYEKTRLRQYFENCYICGDIDFIFGSSATVFQSCKIHSVSRGYVTAASTPKDQRYGYVFRGCTLTGDSGEATVFLGRPWRDFAKTVYIGCTLGAHIKPEGWNDWNKKDAVENTVFYAEFGSTGPGSAGKRAPWAKQLTEEQAAQLTAETVLAGNDAWNPLLPR